MSHTTALPSEQVVTHNGDWSGEIKFSHEVFAVDCIDVVMAIVADDVTRFLEAGHSHLVLERAKLLDALDSYRPFLGALAANRRAQEAT